MKDSKIEKKLLHYTGKAIADYNMIQKGDRILVGLSGGKDSFTLLKLLRLLQIKTNHKFEIRSLTLHQSQPGFDEAPILPWLKESKIPFEIIKHDVYGIVKSKIQEGKNYCSFCSRLRRGIIYRYARENGFNKIALAHHREDLMASLLMSMMYSGEIRSMPPKLLTDTKDLILIRPLVYCQEADIKGYAKEQEFPIIPCGQCSATNPKTRQKTVALIHELAKENPKIPSNILHSLQNVKISQLMDKNLWDFKGLETQQKQFNAIK